MKRVETSSTNGAAAAACLAAGIGCLTLGILTTLKASSQGIRSLLSFYVPTGPLSGQTTLALGVWLIAWFILHRLWKHCDVNFRKIFIISFVLLVLGMVGSFPPLFEAFFEAYE